MRGTLDEQITHLKEELKRLRLQKMALTLLEMVAVLHRMGYEQIRIAPGMSASGMYWRCGITHTGNIRPDHSARSLNFGKKDEEALYTSGDKDKYYGWPDVKPAKPERLAKLFLERFPEIEKRGKGSDPDYVRWYRQMLELARQGKFPVAYADWYSEPNPRFLPTTEGFESGLPMPPGLPAQTRPKP